MAGHPTATPVLTERTWDAQGSLFPENSLTPDSMWGMPQLLPLPFHKWKLNLQLVLH